MSSFRQFGWVPDGIYDVASINDNVWLIRYVIVDGNSKIVITKAWVDNGGPDDVESKLKLPWGTYPTFPPKPPKPPISKEH